ncbi:MAG TPA: hypothetical protein VFE16_02635 [Candidatus Cybelea sp.]|jgi:hypothetical protein|nr:hypothetical protein [Candidatus Cybelea sp.]
MKRRQSMAVAVAFVLLPALPAGAAVMHGHVWEATYVAAYQPTFGRQGYPHSGTMKLKVNNGIISGTYTSESVRPDPLYGRPIAISGNVSQGNITLILQAPGGFTVRGTIAENGEISGTATVKGSFYTFMAKVKSSP